MIGRRVIEQGSNKPPVSGMIINDILRPNDSSLMKYMETNLNIMKVRYIPDSENILPVLWPLLNHDRGSYFRFILQV